MTNFVQKVPLYSCPVTSVFRDPQPKRLSTILVPTVHRTKLDLSYHKIEDHMLLRHLRTKNFFSNNAAPRHRMGTLGS